MKRSFSLSELHESLDDGIVTPTMRRVKSHDNMMKGQLGADGAQNASRVPVLSERELREHFNMPLNEVAKKYGMCTTALKKLCRKYGVMQWPHRKLRSLEKKIASLRAEQRYTTDGQGNLDDEIRKLEAQRESLISGTGEGGDDEAVPGGWSPTAMSPVDLSELGEIGNIKEEGGDPDSFSAHGQGRSRGQVSAAQASRAATVHSDWGGEGPERQAHGPDGAHDDRLQQHIQTLEEENSSLRALSRSLMKERQELLTKSSATTMEMTSLRQMCESLQRQLSQLGEKPGAAAAMAAAVNDVEAMMMDSKARGSTGMQEGGGMLWGQHGGGEEAQMTRRASGGAQQHPQWSHEGAAPEDAPAGGGTEEGDLHALSWMAPDFDLDELL